MRRLRPPTPKGLVTLAVVAAAVLFTFLQLQPRLLFADTTPAGGDMGAHVWGPAYLRDHLLPDWRLSGWTPDWYAGFPAYQFYMVVPSLLILAVDFLGGPLVSYNVAFKLVTVSGLLTLPVAAWAFGRLARLRFPGPALLAVATVPFLFDRNFTIYGGNVPSTLAGEFAFSISLSLALLFVGFVIRGLDTGRHRAIAAVLLGLCVLCHVIPAIFALVAAGVWWLLRPARSRAVWLVSTVVVGGLLSAFWVVPFVLRRAYLNDMGWEKRTDFLELLFPGRIGEALTRMVDWLPGFGDGRGDRALATANLPVDITWVLVLAGFGVVLGVVRRNRVAVYLSVLALIFAVGFVVAPQGRLWNARLLPFWYLCLYLLAAVGVAELARSIATLVARDPSRPSELAMMLAPGVALLVALIVVGLPLGALPADSTSLDAEGRVHTRWFGIDTTDRSFVADWAKWNYRGYERKESWPEYRDLVDVMADVGREEGCGRAMWEYEPELNRFGTPMALMLLPYWTDSCIGSMEGLYFEASATTPYHFLNQSELSVKPSRAQRDLDYGELDVSLGVDHLQQLGVRYYLAFSDQAVQQADLDPDLSLVAESGKWRVYQVAGSDLVEPLAYEPAVMTGIGPGGRDWLEPSQAWYLDPTAWDVPLAGSGPDDWQRVPITLVDDDGDGQADDAEIGRVRRRPLAPNAVRNVRAGDDSMSFDVERVGLPVVVKVSYFPNWKVTGADGPYRLTPNLMVVVPTERHVELDYGTTSVEWLAWLLTFLGVVGIVLLVRRGPVDVPEPPAEEEPEVFADDEADDALLQAELDAWADSLAPMFAGPAAGDGRGESDAGP